MPVITAMAMALRFRSLRSRTLGAKARALPEGTVNFIIPVAVGGGTDLTFRALAEATKPHLNRNIVVINTPGAGGAIGLAQRQPTQATA